MSPSSTLFPADPPVLALPVPGLPVLALEEPLSSAEANAALNTKKTKARIRMENLE
jgi:hypothetical protein